MKFLNKLLRRTPKPENPALVAAIHVAYEQGESPITREKVNRALIKGNLVLPLAPGSTPLPEGPSKTTPRTKFNLIPMHNEKGESAIPVFTDVAQMQRWRPEGGRSVTMRGVDVFRLVLQGPASAVIINISGREPWRVPRALLRILADNMVPQRTDLGVAAVRLKAQSSDLEVAPLSRPLAPHLLAAVEEGIRQNASLIRAAYAVDLGFNRNPPRPAIGILFVRGTDSKTSDKIIGRILRLLPPIPEGQSLDFWALSPKYLARVQAVTKPFFPPD